jgi:hypothetical protein
VASPSSQRGIAFDYDTNDRKRKRRKVDDSAEDTAGEETPDTDDYGSQDSGDVSVTVKPKPRTGGTVKVRTQRL